MPAANQNVQIGIPHWNTPFVDSNGVLTYQWQSFLTSLWQGSNIAPGGTAQPQALTTSPFRFTANEAGSMAIEGSDKIEVSRDGGITWLRVGTSEGLVPLRFDDQLRVTFTGFTTVVWLPNS